MRLSWRIWRRSRRNRLPSNEIKILSNVMQIDFYCSSPCNRCICPALTCNQIVSSCSYQARFASSGLTADGKTDLLQFISESPVISFRLEQKVILVTPKCKQSVRTTNGRVSQKPRMKFSSFSRFLIFDVRISLASCIEFIL